MSKFTSQAGEMTLTMGPAPDYDPGPANEAIAEIDRILLAAGGDVEDAVTDPRTLYVSRRVTNAAAILRWAKAVGITELQPAEKLHVTVAYSRAPVDWLDMGESWEKEITIDGGARIVDRFVDGDEHGVIVLAFVCGSLMYRQREFVENGASWDHPQYVPHITLSYGGVLPEDFEAYQGPIVLGPEVFAELDSDD